MCSERIVSVCFLIFYPTYFASLVFCLYLFLSTVFTFRRNCLAQQYRKERVSASIPEGLPCCNYQPWNIKINADSNGANLPTQGGRWPSHVEVRSMRASALIIGQSMAIIHDGLMDLRAQGCYISEFQCWGEQQRGVGVVPTLTPAVWFPRNT